MCLLSVYLAPLLLNYTDGRDTKVCRWALTAIRSGHWAWMSTKANTASHMEKFFLKIMCEHLVFAASSLTAVIAQ